MDFWDRLHFIHRCYRYKYHTEKQQIQFLFSNVLKGSTVLDIGANRGIYSYWICRCVGSKGVVHAFEPQPEMAHDIERVKSWFGLENLHIHNVALSSKKGKAFLSRKYAGDGGASIEKPVYSEEKIEVKTITLDELVKAENIRSVDFIKCDVEGHELSVFKGALDTIAAFKPIILFEGRVEQKELSELFNILEAQGYDGVMLLDGKFPHYKEYRTVPSQKFGLAGHRDFAFSPKLKARN